LLLDAKLTHLSSLLLNMDSASHSQAAFKPEQSSRLGLLIRRIALVGVTMMLLLAVVSAYLRLSGAGIGCTPWPACYQEQSLAPSHDHHPVARFAHRLLASGLGVVVIMIVSVSVWMRPRRGTILWTSLALLLLTVLLAGLGRVTPAAAGPGIALANLLGGVAMAALLWWLATQAKLESGQRRETLRWPAAAIVALLLLQVSLGALISTTRSAATCASLPVCESSVSEASVALHIAHRATAVALLIAAGALARALLRRNDRAPLGWTLAALVAAQIGLGVAMVVLKFPLWLALAHHAGALLLLLVAVSVLAG
jgi:cytochrome c oxidase assembly protein subunit 15